MWAGCDRYLGWQRRGTSCELVALLSRTTGHIFRRRTVGAAVLLGLTPVAVAVPALAALGLVGAVCALVVAWEVLRFREDRIRVRHPELAA